MAHRAERIRKRNIRELEFFRDEAKRYSYRINGLYNYPIVKHYVIMDIELVDYVSILCNMDIDCTHFYDQMFRETYNK